MIIRPARPNELHFIRSIGKRVQKEATMGLASDDVDLTEYSFQSPNNIYFVLTSNEQLCGWVFIGETPDPHTREVSPMIVELFVLPHFRSSGYGKDLMNFALSFLRNRGFRKVYLNVYNGNPARKLYKKLGFKEISTLMEARL